MRRYVFYLLVALLAFGIGIFFLYLFFPQNSATESGIQAMPTQGFVAVSVSNEPPLHQQTGIESLISDKEKAMLLFEPTLKKWLQKENIVGTIEPSPEIIERISAMKLHRYEVPYLTRMAQKSYKPSLLDLNSDGLSELSILINCDEPNGCELWLFRKAERDFEVILRTTEIFEKFELKKNKSKGFSDVETSYRLTEPDSEALISFDSYKFDGQEYRHRGCSLYVNRYRDKQGKLRNLKKPIIRQLDDCC
jgi:hypothetical protein